MALGKKLSPSLFVLARMDLKHLPEGSRLKKMVTGVADVLQDVSGPAETTGVIDGRQGGQGAATDFFVLRLPPSAASSCLPLCSWRATLSLHRSAGSRWWTYRRSPAVGCLVAPS